MPQMVSVTEAAQALKLAKSTVAEQVGKLGLARDDKRRFDLVEYMRRRDDLMLQKSGNSRGLLLGEREEQPRTAFAADAAGAPATEPEAEEPSELKAARLRRELALAEKAERENLIASEDLLVRSVVEQQLIEQGTRRRDRLLALPARGAAEAGLSPAQRLWLNQALREALEGLADEFERIAAELEEAEPA